MLDTYVYGLAYPLISLPPIGPVINRPYISENLFINKCIAHLLTSEKETQFMTLINNTGFLKICFKCI